MFLRNTLCCSVPTFSLCSVAGILWICFWMSCKSLSCCSFYSPILSLLIDPFRILFWLFWCLLFAFSSLYVAKLVSALLLFQFLYTVFLLSIVSYHLSIHQGCLYLLVRGIFSLPFLVIFLWTLLDRVSSFHSSLIPDEFNFVISNLSVPAVFLFILFGVSLILFLVR